MILEKNEKITTNFEPTDDSDVVNKSYLDEKIKKIDGHISYNEHDYNEFKLQYNKQSVEEILGCENDDTNKMIRVYLIIRLMLIKFWKIFHSLQGVEMK